MNDRELHCRGKASEARSKARTAQSKQAQQAYLIAADEWDREADKAASDYASPPSSSGSEANQAA